MAIPEKFSNGVFASQYKPCFFSLQPKKMLFDNFFNTGHLFANLSFKGLTSDRLREKI